MSATQARELCQTIDWKSTLVLPIPRFVGSYSPVEVNGAQGTLIKGSGRRGPDYVLIWVKNGIDRKSTRLNSSHSQISYAVFCLKKKKESSPGRSRCLSTQRGSSHASQLPG